MSVNVAPFCIEDILDLEVQPKHYDDWLRIVRNLGVFKPFMENEYSHVVFDDATGEVLSCSGILTEPYCMGWAYLRYDLKKYMTSITRVARKLELVPFVRDNGPVFAQIDSQYPQAIRWARILGFRPHDTTQDFWVFDAHSI